MIEYYNSKEEVLEAAKTKISTMKAIGEFVGKGLYALNIWYYAGVNRWALSYPKERPGDNRMRSPYVLAGHYYENFTHNLK